MRQDVDSQRLLKPRPHHRARVRRIVCMEILSKGICLQRLISLQISKLQIPQVSPISNSPIIGSSLTHYLRVLDLLLQSAISSRARFVLHAAHLHRGTSLIETWNQVYQTISIRSAEDNRISHGTGAETLMTRLSPARHPPNKKRRPRCLSRRFRCFTTIVPWG